MLCNFYSEFFLAFKPFPRCEFQPQILCYKEKIVSTIKRWNVFSLQFSAICYPFTMHQQCLLKSWSDEDSFKSCRQEIIFSSFLWKRGPAGRDFGSFRQRLRAYQINCRWSTWILQFPYLHIFFHIFSFSFFLFSCKLQRKKGVMFCC